MASCKQDLIAVQVALVGLGIAFIMLSLSSSKQEVLQAFRKPALTPLVLTKKSWFSCGVPLAAES